MSKSPRGFNYKVIGHNRNLRCPRCKKDRFCEDCAICEACHFACPAVVEPPFPAGQLPKCSECDSTPVHTRLCSTTKRSAIGLQ